MAALNLRKAGVTHTASGLPLGDRDDRKAGRVGIALIAVVGAGGAQGVEQSESNSPVVPIPLPETPLERELGLDPLGETVNQGQVVSGAMIREEFPAEITEVWSSPVGSKTDYQGYAIGVDCTVEGDPDDVPDSIALCIGVAHLNSEPMICDAHVVWSHPSGSFEIDLLDGHELPYTKAHAAMIESRLDERVAALREGLRRGRPCG